MGCKQCLYYSPPESEPTLYTNPPFIRCTRAGGYHQCPMWEGSKRIGYFGNPHTKPEKTPHATIQETQILPILKDFLNEFEAAMLGTDYGALFKLKTSYLKLCQAINKEPEW